MSLIQNSRLVIIIAAIFLLPFSLSCATFNNGNTQNITFNSNRSGLYVSVLNESGECVFSGRTPCKANLARGAGYFKSSAYTVYFKEQAESDAERYPEKITGNADTFWYLCGNLPLSGIIGWFIIDPLTGAMWVLDPDNIRIDLPSKQNDNSNVQ